MHRPCYFTLTWITLFSYLFWEKRATDIILSIILHLITVIQINIIAFILEREIQPTGRSLLYPIIGYGKIYVSLFIEQLHLKIELVGVSTLEVI